MDTEQHQALVQAINRFAYVTVLAALMHGDPNFDPYRRDMQTMRSILGSEIGT